MSTTSLDLETLGPALSRLRGANAAFARRYPGPRPGRQPVHVVYGGAHLFRHDTASRLGALALRALDTWAPDPDAFADAMGVEGDEALRSKLYARVRDKLAREPVEDLRVDFEDGYGPRPHDEEDGHALAVASAFAAGLRAGTLPPFTGIRVKSLGEETATRALRTLDLVLTALAPAGLPRGFVVTLPKVVAPEQVEALAVALACIERKLGLARVEVELMVEAPQTLDAGLARLVEAADGRCVAAHFGAYDYTAACGVAAADQSLDHPLCDHARHAMHVALAGTGVRLSDGATTVLPVAPHRGDALSGSQRKENLRVVHRAWSLHRRNVSRALAQGFHQGWDLHPAQLPARYAAVYGHYLRHADDAGRRLRAFLAQAAKATRGHDVFDDAATALGLVGFFLGAVDAGALTEAEAEAHAGVSVARMRGRSFAAMVG